MVDEAAKKTTFTEAKLKESFASDSVDERVRAALECVEYPTADIIDLLAQQLEKDSSAFVRATIVKSLAQAGGGKHVSAILKALDDEDDRVRANVFEALESAGATKETVAFALRHFADPSSRVRKNARTHFSSADEQVKKEALEHMLKEEHNDFRLAALRYFKRQGEEAGSILVIEQDKLVELVAPLREAMNQDIRFNAFALLKHLAQGGNDKAAEILKTSQGDDNWDSEEGPPPTFVTESPDSIGPESRRGRLYHPEAEVRLAEIGAIVDQGLKEELPLLRERCVVEEDPLVIKALLDGLRRLGGSAERSFLVGYLAAGPMPVRQAAIEALGALGDDLSLAALEPYLEHDNIQLKAAAAAVLSGRRRIDGHAFLKPLLDTMKRDDLLCALMMIRRSPFPKDFHESLAAIHNGTTDEMVRNYAQETERVLLRRGLLDKNIVS